MGNNRMPSFKEIEEGEVRLGHCTWVEGYGKIIKYYS